MGRALYRKYRPQSLDEIFGQEHITDTLRNAIKKDAISHAYLLTGPRGVGKTSIARILAYELNAIPYDESSTYMDIIEIDAASNRRIDEIRDLRDKVNVLPSQLKYKIYIIDEVHMLTKEAFNALLKTLEEPPAHVIFILATTESHKLPDTIISRTQHFTFKPIDTETLVLQLGKISKKESIAIDKGALTLLAQHGRGSFRDSISLLDQVQGIEGKIDTLQIQRLLGIVSDEVLDQLLAALQAESLSEIAKLLESLRTQGIQGSDIAKQLAQKIRDSIYVDTTMQSLAMTGLLKALIDVPTSFNPDKYLEVVLLEYIFNSNPQPQPIPAPKTQQVENVEPVQKKPKKEAAAEAQVKVEKPAPVTKSIPAKKTVAKSSADHVDFSDELWPIIVADIKKTNSTIYGILRMSQMKFEDNTIELLFKFPFHQKQINEAKNKKVIEEIIKKHTGQSIPIVCSLTEKPKSNNIDAISNIFEGSEVLESGS
jgi:DNA polymerase-3 subunit gamma/tau